MSTDRLIAELIGTYGMFMKVPFRLQDPAAVPLANVARVTVPLPRDAPAVYACGANADELIVVGVLDRPKPTVYVPPPATDANETVITLQAPEFTTPSEIVPAANAPVAAA
jgi:hypothetical protein